jgi:hypothetical protein
MNARIERAMNSENLGARIMRNGALDQKIWVLEACKGKMVFSGGFGATLKFLEWLEGLDAIDRVLRNLGISRGFLWNFWSVWSDLVPVRN